jgi:two-component system sensor histidine kinase PilS (NtrC family)
MDPFGQIRRLGWFLPLRLAAYVILLGVVVIWMGYPGYLELPFFVYSLLTLGFTLVLFFETRFRLPMVAQVVIGLQFLLEIIVDSGVIYASGNVHSQFSALFILTIVSASLFYRLVGTLVIASAVSTAYTYIIWLGLHQEGSTEGTLSVLKTIFSASDSVFYAIFLHLLIFYLVAFISGYLADRLRKEKAALDDTSRQLRRARLETDDILRHLNSGLLTVDAAGYIVYFNRAAEKILGYREEEIKGLRANEAFAGRMPELSGRLQQALHFRQDEPRKEITIVNGLGQTVPLGLSTSVLLEERGLVRGVIAIFSDLTEAKAMEAKVRAADRLAAVGELSASIAHEIRNPLAAISGSVEVLMGELVLEGQNRQLMELIVKESHRLSRILSDFLDYARIAKPRYDKVDLHRTVNDVIELLRHHHTFSDKIRMAFDSDESIVSVVGDADLIRQLLLNLAINACDAFEGREGTLAFVVEVNRYAGQAKLYVRDTGPGMSPEQLEKVFQPFYSTKKHGTGLGLSIVHRICSMLALGLDVTSKPGEGTCFSIAFRLHRTNAVAAPSEPVAQADELTVR